MLRPEARDVHEGEHNDRAQHPSNENRDDVVNRHHPRLSHEARHDTLSKQYATNQHGDGYKLHESDRHVHRRVDIE